MPLPTYQNPAITNIGTPKFATKRVPIEYAGSEKSWTSQNDWNAEDLYTKALLHLSGDNNSKETVDDSYFNTPVTFGGNAKIITSVADPFGNSSGVLDLDGSGSFLLLPNSDKWYLADNNFTIRLWVRFDDRTGLQYFVMQYPDDTPYFFLYKTADHKLYFTYRHTVSGGTDIVTDDAVFTADDTWYEVMFVRSGNTPYMLIDGVLKAVTITNAFVTMENIPADLTIGDNIYDANELNGQIAEFRFVNGQALKTASYSKQTSPHVYTQKSKINTSLTSGSIILAGSGSPASGFYSLANLPQAAYIKAYWKFEETSGTIIDQKEAFNGTYGGDLYAQTGKINNALGFDGVDDDMNISSPGALSVFSVAGWIKIDSFTNSSYMGIIGTTTGQSFSTTNGFNGFGILMSAAPDTRITYPLPLGEWVHVGATYDGTTLKYYVNGLEIYSIAVTDTWGLTADVRIGTGWATPAGVPNWYFFDGLIDELCLWNGATLTALEMAKLHGFQSSGYIRKIFDSGEAGRRWLTYDFTGDESLIGANIKVRARTAALEASLTGAAWNGWLDEQSGNLNCPSRRWIELEARLETSYGSSTPRLDDIAITHITSGVTYELQISTTETFASTILDQTDIPDSYNGMVEYTLTALQGAGLTTGTKYFYRWRTKYSDPEEYSKWSKVASFYYDSTAQFNTQGNWTEYAPDMWALVNIDDCQDRYEIERYPYPYEIIPARQENRNRALNGDLKITNIATKYEIETSFDIIGQNGYNEFKRFYMVDSDFYLIAFIDGCRNIWKVILDPAFDLQPIAPGSQDHYTGRLRFKEV